MNERDDKRAILLLSGGMDSATLGAIARDEGYALHAVSVRYGQKAKAELQAARKVADRLGVEEHLIIDIDLDTFGGSALTTDQDIPRNRSADEMGNGIPATYVPARNTIFLGYALAFAEVRQAGSIFIGVNAVDYSGYPDCRPDFIKAFQKMANLATRIGTEGRGVTVRTPLIDMSKADIIKRANALGMDLSITVSCYGPDDKGRACGYCDACILRKKGFEEAGVPDVTRYQKET